MKKKTPYDQGSADCWAERDRDLTELNWSPEQVQDYHKGWAAQEVLGDYWRDKNQDLNQDYDHYVGEEE